jgi:hypothetical protein
MRLIVSTAAGVLFLTAIAQGATSADCSVPAVMSDGGAVSSPANQGLDQRVICSIGSGLAQPDRARSLSLRAGTFGRGAAGHCVELQRGGVWLLGLILRKVSGQLLDEFAKATLFEPLGINNWEWERFPNGDPYTSGGLRLRLRDFAKLVLDDGVWQGSQIVSAG